MPEIKLNKTHDIYDSSKLKAIKECPRKYFFRYLLGWRPEVKAHPLSFGAAVHEGFEVVFKAHVQGKGYNALALPKAQEAFLKCYRKDFPPDTDGDFGSKSPAKAFQVFEKYCQQYNEIDKDNKTIDVEVSGFAPIGDEEKLYFRLDVVIETPKGIVCLDHKTTSMDSAIWDAQWILDFQMGTYTHGLFCLFGEEAYGTYVNGLVFRKEPMIKRIVLLRTPQMLEFWRTSALRWLKFAKDEQEKMMNESGKSPAMKSFPPNTDNCTKWNRVCPYHDLCVAWANPLKRINEDGSSDVPGGFECSFWNPTERQVISGNNA